MLQYHIAQQEACWPKLLLLYKSLVCKQWRASPQGTSCSASAETGHQAALARAYQLHPAAAAPGLIFSACKRYGYFLMFSLCSRTWMQMFFSLLIAIVKEFHNCIYACLEFHWGWWITVRTVSTCHELTLIQYCSRLHICDVIRSVPGLWYNWITLFCVHSGFYSSIWQTVRSGRIFPSTFNDKKCVNEGKYFLWGVWPQMTQRRPEHSFPSGRASADMRKWRPGGGSGHTTTNNINMQTLALISS